MTGDHDFSAQQRYGEEDDEDNLNARQPLSKAQPSQNTPQGTSDAPENTSPSVQIPVVTGVDATQPITRPQSRQDTYWSSQATNKRISDNDTNHITTLLRFTPVTLLAVFVLLGILYWYHMIG